LAFWEMVLHPDRSVLPDVLKTGNESAPVPVPTSH
jgi:hypothetical protein